MQSTVFSDIHLASYVFRIGRPLTLLEPQKPEGPILVAIKEMKQFHDVQVNYNKELDTLRILQDLDNPHLIKPIAAIDRGDGRCYFVFPWAAGGNLREYWRDNDLKPDKDLVLWMIEQMAGLAEALCCLYRRNGRHGDLKPENILIHKAKGNKHGILQLADMGLAKFHILATAFRDQRTSTRAGTFKYEPPEANHQDPNRPTSRDYDVWSMGCVYLEFLIWLLYGYTEIPGLSTFHAKLDEGTGKFWQQEVGGSRRTLNKAVDDFIDLLAKRVVPGTSLRAVLDLVRFRMLVIKSEQPGAPERHDASKVRDDLREIYERAVHEPSETLQRAFKQSTTDPFVASSLTLALPRRRDIPRNMPSSLPLTATLPDDDDQLSVRFMVNGVAKTSAITIPHSVRRPAMEVSV
jgi:serine/threonine protein kinase